MARGPREGIRRNRGKTPPEGLVMGNERLEARRALVRVTGIGLASQSPVGYGLTLLTASA